MLFAMMRGGDWHSLALRGSYLQFVLYTWSAFGSEVSSAKGGTAMGQKHSVVSANIFMSRFFEAFSRANLSWKAYIAFFKPFLDALFGFLLRRSGPIPPHFDQPVAPQASLEGPLPAACIEGLGLRAVGGGLRASLAVAVW